MPVATPANGLDGTDGVQVQVQREEGVRQLVGDIARQDRKVERGRPGRRGRGPVRFAVGRSARDLPVLRSSRDDLAPARLF
jgi:hypothetical protein